MRGPVEGLTWKQLFGRLKDRWLDDDMGDVAGSVTFFAVLALFPFLIFLVALAGFFLTPHVVESAVDELSRVAPQAVVEIVGDRIRALEGATSASLLTFSAAIAVFSASGGMISLMNALNQAYNVKEKRSFVKKRLLAIVMTLIAAAGSLIAGVAAVVLPPIAQKIGGPAATILAWIRLPLAALITMLIWAALYWVLPNVKRRFQILTPGAVVGVVLWAVASWAFSLYVSHFGKYEVTYGALGSVAILLFWMWISVQVLLLGAEINAVLEEVVVPEARAAEAPPEPVRPRPKPSFGRRVADAGLVVMLARVFGRARGA